jgi:hypothetical protein
VLVAIYEAISIAVGTCFLGGAGVDVNAMFDADIALALAAGLALSVLLRRSDAFAHIAGRALVLASLLPLALWASAVPGWRTWEFWLRPMQDEASLAKSDIAFLRGHAGPAMCESLAFCYWAGKPAEVDVFNLDQQLVARARNPAPFLQLLDARHFAIVEIDDMRPFPLPPDAQKALLQSYRVDHANDEGVFFVRR